jgi:charged multivesicular body protein 6
MGCFSSAHKAQEDDRDYDNAVLQVKVSRDRLKKYQNRLEADNERETKLAIKLAKEGKRDRAKLVIKAKKAREVMIQKADNMLATLQRQLDNLEQAKLTADLVESLRATNSVLKDMNEKLTVEMVEELMDENAEQADKIKEISELLGENMSQQDQQDAEDEYERMLAELNLDGEEKEKEKEKEPEEPQEQEVEEQEQEEEAPVRVAALA